MQKLMQWQSRRVLKSMAKWTVESRINCGIQVKICSTMLLHSKEGWIIVISTRLLEIEPIYDKGQDITTLN